MTTGTYGTLRHCLMAGMRSAAETTSTLGSTSDDDYASERRQAESGEVALPVFGGHFRAIREETNYQSHIYRRVSLHCERDWVEENS